MKLLVVDIGGLYRSISAKWPGRRLDYLKVKQKIEADIHVAIGYHVKTEHKGFVRVLRMMSYLTLYERVDNLELARSAVNIALKVVQCNHLELILGTDDPLILPLLRQQRQRMIPVHLLSVDPSRSMVNEVSKVTLITEDMLLPLPDKDKRFPDHTQEQINEATENS